MLRIIMIWCLFIVSYSTQISPLIRQLQTTTLRRPGLIKQKLLIQIIHHLPQSQGGEGKTAKRCKAANSSSCWRVVINFINLIDLSFLRIYCQLCFCFEQCSGEATQGGKLKIRGIWQLLLIYNSTARSIVWQSLQCSGFRVGVWCVLCKVVE